MKATHIIRAATLITTLCMTSPLLAEIYNVTLTAKYADEVNYSNSQVGHYIGFRMHGPTGTQEHWDGFPISLQRKELNLNNEHGRYTHLDVAYTKKHDNNEIIMDNIPFKNRPLSKLGIATPLVSSRTCFGISFRC